MLEYKFYDLENIDGYFSGVIFIMVEDKRYILNFGYDVEFQTLKLMNCNNTLYNSHFAHYSEDEIIKLERDYYDVILMEIKNYLHYNY